MAGAYHLIVLACLKQMLDWGYASSVLSRNLGPPICGGIEEFEAMSGVSRAAFTAVHRLYRRETVFLGSDSSNSRQLEICLFLPPKLIGCAPGRKKLDQGSHL
jgi:hypothetical protein